MGFISIDLLVPLLNTKMGSQHVLIVMDRYTKLTRAVSFSIITARKVSQAFTNYWVMMYGIPDFLLTSSGPQLVAKFFASVFGFLGFKKKETTA